MAAENLDIIVSVIDKATAELKSITSGLKSRMDEATESSKAVATAFAGVTAAAGALAVAVGVKSVQAAQEAELAQTRLAHIMKTATGASDEQVASLIEQSDALERVGVVSGGVIQAAQGTLATFDLQAESIQRLIPSFLNMVVAEKGVNATTEDMIGMANGLGKVLQGQVGALSKQGFVFDEATEAMLKNGTETQKVTALAEILDSTYDGLNERMRQTSAGGVVGLKMQLGKLSDEIGGMLLPHVNKAVDAFSKWLDSMGGVEGISTKLSESLKTIQPYIPIIAGVIIGALVPALYAAAAAMAAFVAPLLPFIAIGAAVGIAIIGIRVAAEKIIEIWPELKAAFLDAWESIKNKFDEAKRSIQEGIVAVVEAVRQKFDEAKQAALQAWQSFSDGIKAIWDGIVQTVKGFGQAILDALKFAVSLAVGIVIALFSAMGIDIIQVLSDLKQWIIEKWNEIAEGVKAGLSAFGDWWREKWTELSDFFKEVWEDAKGWFAEKWDEISGKASSGVDAVKGKVSEGWQSVATSTRSRWAEISSSIKVSMDAITAAAQPWIEATKKAFSMMWDGIKNVAEAAWEGIKSTVKSGINWIIEKINALISAANNIAKKGAGALGISIPQIPTIPMLAKGGIITGAGQAIVGEAGPELVSLPRGAQVSPLPSGAGGITIVINNPQMWADEDVVEKIGNPLIQVLKQHMAVT